MADYKLIAQRIGLVGLTNVLLSLSGIILLPILTKNMSIEDYGIWTQIYVTIGIFPGLVTFGLPYATVRFLPALNNKLEIQETFYSIFFFVLFTSGTASLLFYLFSETIALSLFDGNDSVVKILSLIILFECLNTLLLSYFRANEQIKRYSSVVLLQTTSQIFIVSLFVLMGKGILGATFGLLIKTFIIFLVMFYNIISEIGIHKPHFKKINEFLNFGMPMVPGNFSNWIANSSDRYVIGLFLGMASVGYYSPGYALGSLISVFLSPLSFLLPVILSKHYEVDDIKEVKIILSYSFKCLMAISIPAVFGISLLSKSILIILSTPEIASKGYLITPFVALSTFLLGPYGIFYQVLILEKKTKIVGNTWIVAALLNLGLNFIFIPYIGILGAAITTLIAFTFSFVIVTYYSRRMLKFDLNIGFILKCIFSSILMSLTIVIINPIKIHEILVTICICIGVYFLTLILLGGFEKREIDFVKTMVKV